MSINHNRIKVADLEKNQPNKILTTNSSGELVFSDRNDIKIDSYNALDYTISGKALDARQGKILKDLVDNINTLLTSDNVNLDTVQELVDAIETVQMSLSSILVNDLTTGGTTKALTAEMGKLLQANKVDKDDSGFVEAMIGYDASSFNPIIKVNSTKTNIVITVDNPLDQSIAYIIFGAGFTPYDGKLFTITNKLNTDLTLGQAFFKTVNQVLRSGATVSFLYDSNNGNPVFRQIDGYHEITDFLNKDIRLGNYPSTRNDGQLPTNKVLAPDVNGNLKLYTIATAPAPYLDELIPDSYLPSNTGNFILKGSFFTPTMTVTIVGQTVNYKTFISDNEVRVNVTTGSAEGYFDVVLNNGISATFSKALHIVLGTVYKPNSLTWTNKTINADTSEDGSLNVGVYGSQDSADWNQIFDITKNFRFSFNAFLTPFSSVKLNNSAFIILKDLSGNEKYKIKVHDIYFYFYENGSTSHNWALWSSYRKNIELRWVSGVLYFYADGELIKTSTLVFTGNLKLTAIVKYYDLKNIRYVELAQ